jgi:hypothetical protein
MTNTFSLWEFLSRDVAFLGGPSSPMLSWLGVFGILLFFLWHVIKLKKEVVFVQRGFERVCPMLAALVHERGDVDRERFTHRPDKVSIHQARRGVDSTMRSDCDDLQILDVEMNKEPLFRGLWAQYRMTLILERVPWFLEPRLFSTRGAETVLTQEALMANRVNLPFYSQFPSLVTGMGLLLTFLALFVGLGKLHAEGSEIVGIQGLINGLAGKFLTSIVGLMVANLFTFIEKPMVSRLMHAHHTFLGLIDQLFPRKTMEQLSPKNYGADVGTAYVNSWRTSGGPFNFRRGPSRTGWRMGNRTGWAHGQFDVEYSVLDQIAGDGACGDTTHDVRPPGSHQTGASGLPLRINGDDS